MTVTLNIENDAELRAYIKDCINGQVLAIVREEFVEAVKAEIVRKIGTMATRNFEAMQKDAFEAAAKHIILKNNGINDWNNDFINPIASAIVNDRVNKAVAGIDWKKAVDTLAKEKVKALIS